MRTFIIYLILSLTFVGCDTSNKRTDSLSQEDQNGITELRNKLVSAIRAGDAETYGMLCSADVRLMHPNAPIINGREALVKHNAEMFDAVKVTSLILSPVEVYGIGDLAYEIGTQSLQIDPPMEGFKSSRKYLHVMRKSGDGDWQFVALMSSDN